MLKTVVRSDLARALGVWVVAHSHRAAGTAAGVLAESLRSRGFEAFAVPSVRHGCPAAWLSAAAPGAGQAAAWTLLLDEVVTERPGVLESLNGRGVIVAASDRAPHELRQRTADFLGTTVTVSAGVIASAHDSDAFAAVLGGVARIYPELAEPLVQHLWQQAASAGDYGALGATWAFEAGHRLARVH